MSFDMKRHLLPALPSYSGGRVSEGVYNAGTGLHDRYNDGKPFVFAWKGDRKELVEFLRRFEYSGYQADRPYDENNLGQMTFSNGASAFAIRLEEGTLTVEQTRCAYEAVTDEPVLVRTVQETTAAEFISYREELRQQGFDCSWANQLEDNLFFEAVKDGRTIHGAYYAATATARFADDRLSATLSSFSGGVALPGVETRLCQFGLKYEYMRPGKSANCGMMYFLRLPDNSIFMVDGGEMEQATDDACGEIMRLMRELTAAPEGEKIRIAAWFCTHAHDDHMDFFAKLLRFYSDQLTVERVIFNFPANEHYVLMPQTHILLERLHAFCPDVKYLKAHTGQRFTLAGVTCEVLLTHEDASGMTGRETIGRFNDTSTVLKVSFDGTSFIFLGDMDDGAERVILSHFTERTLRCSGVQVAHHMINSLQKIYFVIQPDVMLVPQHIFRARPSNETHQLICKAAPYSNQYFASAATDIFHAEEGKLMITERYPVIGGYYDHSQV